MSYGAAVAFSIIFAILSLVEGVFIAVLLIRIIKGIKVEQEICALWLLVGKFIKSLFERGRERSRGVRSTSTVEEGNTNEPTSSSTDARYNNFSDHQKSSNSSFATPPPPHPAGEGMNEAIQSLASVMKAKEAPMRQSVTSTPDCRRSSSTKASSQKIARGSSKSFDNSLTATPPPATTPRQKQQENPPTVIFTSYSTVDVVPKPQPIVTPYEVPVATAAKPLSDDVVLASYDKVTDSRSVPPVYTEPNVKPKSRFK